MVRRAPALLSAARRHPAALAALLCVLALVYLLVAPALPASGNGGLRLDAALGTLAVCTTVLTLAPLAEAWFATIMLALGSVLVAGAFDAAGARSGATFPEAAAWCAGGLLFARAFAPAPLAVGVPLLVGALDLAGVVNTAAVLHGVASAGDPLTLELPRLGGGQSAALPGLEAGLPGALAEWARRHGFRTGWTSVLMVEAAVLGVVLALPSLALICAVYLLANLDRAAEAVRLESAGQQGVDEAL